MASWVDFSSLLSIYSVGYLSNYQAG